MAKHTSYKDKLREAEFKRRIFESLKAARNQGLLQGSRAMLHVVGDKIAEENGKTPEEKLLDIMNFVNTSLAMTEKTAKDAEKEAADARKPIEELGKDPIDVPDEAANANQEAGDK